MRRSFAEPHPARAAASRAAVATPWAPLFALLLASGACAPGDSLAPRTTSWRVEPAATADQVALPGSEVLAPTVTVTDSGNRPARRVVVRFTVRDGDGRVAVTEETTDAEGQASSGRWTVGQALGLHRVHAEIVGEPLASAEFRVTAVPGRGPLALDGQCPVPDTLLPTGWPLARTAGRLGRREPLTVVAIGSSSTAGTGATTPDSAYPVLLQRHLRSMYPASRVTVVNAGRGGQTLEQLQARFASDVAARSPDLVILQTGTVDAINGVPLDRYEARLREAVAAIRAMGADVVLLDSQRFPHFGESATYDAYQVATRRAAQALGVPVARRHAWMLYWLQSRTYGYPAILGADAFHPSDLTYSCTARLFADGIAGAVRGLAATP